jgi:D-hexose-6-phosphate mutarotase
VAGDGEIKLDSTNLPDTVVWNPWNEKVIGGLNF